MKSIAERATSALAATAFAVLFATHATALWTANPAVNLAIQTGPGDQVLIAAAPDSAGGMYVIWVENRTDLPNNEIRAQRVGRDGSLLWAVGGVLVATNRVYPYSVKATTDQDGGVYLAWSQSSDSTGSDIYAQHLTPLGDRLWGSAGAPVCTATRDQDEVKVALDVDGGLLVCWSDERNLWNGDEQFDVYAQKLDRNSTVAWQTDGVPVSVTAASNNTSSVQITHDGAGGAFVVWSERRYGTYEIGYAQRIDAVGSIGWIENGAEISPIYASHIIRGMAPVASGGFTVAYEASTGWLQGAAYVQRISESGTPVWPDGGRVLFSGYSSIWLQGFVANGPGGAVAFCRLTDSSGHDYGSRAQTVSDSGDMPWGVNGVSLGTSTEYSYSACVMQSETGDVFVSMSNAASQIFVEKIAVNGSKIWGPGPVPVCTLEGDRGGALVVSDGMGGAIAVWNDFRNGTPDIYAHRIPAFGPPGPEPVIASVRDIPNDQGGKMKVSWRSSYHDIAPIYGISSYLIWRSVPPNIAEWNLGHGALFGTPSQENTAVEGSWLTATADQNGQITYWEYVGSQIAVGDPGYSFLVPTTSDSLGAANPYTLVRVQARAASGTTYYSSQPDSGYSVDNLPPAPPTGVRMTGSVLVWDRSAAADFHAFRVYGTETNHLDETATFLATTTNTYLEVQGLGHRNYLIVATDINGNQSAEAVLDGAASLHVPTASVAVMEQNRPNPFNPRTTIKYDLPESGPVRLSVFDVAGRLVCTLVDESMPQGSHEAVWDGRDSTGRGVGSGSYLARLEFGGRVEVVRMGLVR